MNYFTAGLLILLAVTVHSEEMPIVTMQTNVGTIVLELNSAKAPKTVANFLRYAQDGFYDDTIFHRVIRRYIIQGGGYTQNFEKKSPLYDPIPNESDNGLKNLRGTITMSRNSNDPHSATSQFFINVNDNSSLNYVADKGSFDDSSDPHWGYTVFGHIIDGQNVVDKIQREKTGKSGRKYAPKQLIIIERVTVENLPVKPIATLSSTVEATHVVETDTDDTLSATQAENRTQPASKSADISSPPVASSAVERNTDSFSALQIKKETLPANPTVASSTVERNTDSFSALQIKKETLPANPTVASSTVERNTDSFSAIQIKKETLPANPRVPALSPPVTLTTETETETRVVETTNVAKTESQPAAQTPSYFRSERQETLLSPYDSPSQPEKPEPLPD